MKTVYKEQEIDKIQGDFLMTPPTTLTQMFSQMVTQIVNPDDSICCLLFIHNAWTL